MIAYLADYKPTIEELRVQGLVVYLKWKSSVPLESLDRPIILYSINGSDSYSYYYSNFFFIIIYERILFIFLIIRLLNGLCGLWRIHTQCNRC